RGSHGFDHVERVLALALRLGAESGADARVLALAALLHDVGRAEEDRSAGATCHAAAGAVIAREVLRRHGADDALVRRVADCVRRHRFRGAARPVSREAKLLYDADKLDSLGAVGVGRAFLFAGEVGARLHAPAAASLRARPYGRGDTAHREWLVKLRHLHGRMLTPAGRRLAAERSAYMAAFFERLAAEAAGRR
ncbi:MAG TPA: HD domain-containing protein, partial [bacterium]